MYFGLVNSVYPRLFLPNNSPLLNLINTNGVCDTTHTINIKSNPLIGFMIPTVLIIVKIDKIHSSASYKLPVPLIFANIPSQEGGIFS